MELTPLYTPQIFNSRMDHIPMQVAIFMSGSGTNARKILERWETYERRIEVHQTGGKGGSWTPETSLFEPALIVTDNPDSKAAEIAKVYQTKEGLALRLWVNPIEQFFQRNQRDEEGRKHYDSMQKDIAETMCIDLVALAGYDWIVSKEIYNNFITINVHPGDLRVKKAKDGKPKYTGLAWVPSAKAILDGNDEVYTSVHRVTKELDGGPLLAVSKQQPIPEGARIPKRNELLGEGRSLSDVIRFVKTNKDMSESEIDEKFPIVGYARDCQNRLKEHGDWVIFPQVIEDIARGRYARDQNGKIYFDDRELKL